MTDLGLRGGYFRKDGKGQGFHGPLIVRLDLEWVDAIRLAVQSYRRRMETQGTVRLICHADDLETVTAVATSSRFKVTVAAGPVAPNQLWAVGGNDD